MLESHLAVGELNDLIVLGHKNGATIAEIKNQTFGGKYLQIASESKREGLKLSIKSFRILGKELKGFIGLMIIS